MTSNDITSNSLGSTSLPLRMNKCPGIHRFYLWSVNFPPKRPTLSA